MKNVKGEEKYEEKMDFFRSDGGYGFWVTDGMRG